MIFLQNISSLPASAHLHIPSWSGHHHLASEVCCSEFLTIPIPYLHPQFSIASNFRVTHLNIKVRSSHSSANLECLCPRRAKVRVHSITSRFCLLTACPLPFSPPFSPPLGWSSYSLNTWAHSKVLVAVDVHLCIVWMVESPYPLRLHSNTLPGCGGQKCQPPPSAFLASFPISAFIAHNQDLPLTTLFIYLSMLEHRLPIAQSIVFRLVQLLAGPSSPSLSNCFFYVNIFTAFIKFVTLLLLSYVSFFGQDAYGMWLSTRAQAHTPTLLEGEV